MKQSILEVSRYTELDKKYYIFRHVHIQNGEWKNNIGLAYIF